MLLVVTEYHAEGSLDTYQHKVGVAVLMKTSGICVKIRFPYHNLQTMTDILVKGLFSYSTNK
jgi:GTP cyclohydrolase I